MPTDRTPRAGLQIPDYLDRRWDVPMLAALAQLDATEAVGALAVKASTVDSSMAPTGLGVTVGAGRYVLPDGSVGTYAGGTATVGDDTTTYVYLKPDGTIGSATGGFPGLAEPHAPLAVVVAASGDITSVTDARPAVRLIGPARPVAREAGTDPAMGVATLVAGSVVVSTDLVTADSRIFLTHQTAGGTVGVPFVYARTAGTSFTIHSTSSSDTSTIAWLIVEPTA